MESVMDKIRCLEAAVSPTKEELEDQRMREILAASEDEEMERDPDYDPSPKGKENVRPVPLAVPQKKKTKRKGGPKPISRAGFRIQNNNLGMEVRDENGNLLC